MSALHFENFSLDWQDGLDGALLLHPSAFILYPFLLIAIAPPRPPNFYDSSTDAELAHVSDRSEGKLSLSVAAILLDLG